MKKYFLFIVILIVAISTGLYGFIDKKEESREKIRRKLEEIRFIRGTLISGRGIAYMDAVAATGPFFENLSIIEDHNQIINLDLDVATRPALPMIAGAQIRFKADMAGTMWFDGGKAMTIRKVYIKGVLYEFITLSFGSVSEKFTPFTLFAPLDLIPMRTSLFYPYYLYDIYDNRLENKDEFPFRGFKADMEFLVGGSGRTLGIKALAVRLAGTDDEPDNAFARYLFGADCYLLFKEMARISFVWCTIKDYGNTGAATEYNTPILNTTMSGEWELDMAPILLSMEKSFISAIGFQGESAVSSFDPDIRTNVLLDDTTGYAHTVSFYTKLKEMAIFKAGWKSVDYEYVAPAAQTRMATPGGHSPVFGDMPLSPFLIDYSYHNFLRVSRDYYDVLNFTYPMNIATPNRTGFFGDLMLDFKYVNLYTEVHSLQEVRPVSAPNINKRTFFRNVNEISFPFPDIEELKIKSMALIPEISFFSIMERVKRDDYEPTSQTNQNEAEDCKMDVYGVDVVFVLLKNLMVSAIYQIYSVSGRKTKDVYNSHQALKISGYEHKNLDIKNKIVGVGLYYSFGPATSANLDYFLKSYAGNYDLDHMRLLFQYGF